MYHKPRSWLVGFDPKHCWCCERKKLIPQRSAVVEIGFVMLSDWACDETWTGSIKHGLIRHRVIKRGLIKHGVIKHGEIWINNIK